MNVFLPFLRFFRFFFFWFFTMSRRDQHIQHLIELWQKKIIQFLNNNRWIRSQIPSLLTELALPQSPLPPFLILPSRIFFISNSNYSTRPSVRFSLSLPLSLPLSLAVSVFRLFEIHWFWYTAHVYLFCLWFCEWILCDLWSSTDPKTRCTKHTYACYNRDQFNFWFFFSLLLYIRNKDSA